MKVSRASIRMFTVRIKVERTPPISTATGIKGSPEVAYEQLMATPIDPVSKETVERLLTESPIGLFETFVLNDDNRITIMKGDEITNLDDQKVYKVREPMAWTFAQIQLVLEQQRSS